jgi:hypothetical protein
MTAAQDERDPYTAQLSAWLERPEVRITRAMKLGEWATRDDIFGALELTLEQRVSYQRRLEQLVTDCVVRQHAEVGGVRYLLLRQLEPPAPPSTDDEVTHELVLAEPGIDGAVRSIGLRREFYWRGSWRPW